MHVAPLAVSDAAMLAPEEVFSGNGDIKEETELTKADRKRRRAKKKRQFKAESVERMSVKTQLSTLKKPEDGQLSTKWIGLFEVQTQFPNGTVEIKNAKSGKAFKVNGQRLKAYYGHEPRIREELDPSPDTNHP
ncbi:uncharacterized protein LOC131019018 [Salvia miltiorrhiza]|uniref:uncharacterized protein LOC131019018 n=1 Tax=Salvia miltiorrhiza TaxID=226208 RepID=UPI0025AD44FC|nr:uncharacterized protein LOC131019018 [Salvia miltiorrhiza]